jgi:hypothetical protein
LPKAPAAKQAAAVWLAGFVIVVKACEINCAHFMETVDLGSVVFTRPTAYTARLRIGGKQAAGQCNNYHCSHGAF